MAGSRLFLCFLLAVIGMTQTNSPILSLVSDSKQCQALFRLLKQSHPAKRCTSKIDKLSVPERTGFLGHSASTSIADLPYVCTRVPAVRMARATRHPEP